ncbi:MAG: response regulator [Lachnospiraceae bacterium]|nr:response regulator [Lachnospiraceae bacterium]
MIFKLLIVDDEATMRKGIANFMNWESIDCEVAGTASDGLEAIGLLQKIPVDIIITDIKMPEADGLEIAKYVCENHLDIKVILLTGYADFEYAQTAIRYNVSSFILKPTNKKSLFEAVQEAQKALIVSKKNSTMAKEELAFLKDQLLQELTDQPYTKKRQDRLDELGFSLENYCVAAFQALSAGDDIAALKRIIIEEKRNAYCYRYNHLIITVYFLPCFCAQVPPEILDNCREIAEIAGSLSEKDVIAGISVPHRDAWEFGIAVSEAIRSLSLNFYTEENISLFSEAPENDASILTAENSMDLYCFENCLNNREFDNADGVINSIFMKFKSSLVNSSDAKNICAQIYYICSRVLLKKSSILPDTAVLETEFLSELHSAPDIFSLEQATRRLAAVTRQRLVGDPGSQNKLAGSAIAYIHSHLSEPLSLESIAEDLHISASHLSRTFKKVLNESLTEYINKTRIAKAKEYLQTTDTLTYEIAELVGYHDPTYFSSIFKKYTGVSPTEYRQRQNRPH